MYSSTAMPSSGEADHTAGHQPRIHLGRDDIAPLLALYFKQTPNSSIEGNNVTILFSSSNTQFYEFRVSISPEYKE